MSLTLLSQALVAGGLGGFRPFLTLLLLSLYARFVAEVALPHGDAWLLHPYALAALGGLALAEHFARQDADMWQVLRTPLRVLAVVAGVWAGRLLVALGEDPAQWQQVVGMAAALPLGLSLPAEPGQAAALLVAAGAGLLATEVKQRVLQALDALAVPGRWWRWLETGGIAGVLAAIVLAPFLAVILAFALTVASVLGLYLARRLLRALEDRDRVPCPACERRVRPEAQVCPGCRSPLVPQRVLAADAPPLPLAGARTER